MNYIIARADRAIGRTVCALSARRQSTDGRVLLNENDLKKGELSLKDAVAAIDGIVLTENEAVNELNKEEWA